MLILTLIRWLHLEMLVAVRAIQLSFVEISFVLWVTFLFCGALS